jgi:ABC-type branched-subunit amino acid transport system substrate-binding protein
MLGMAQPKKGEAKTLKIGYLLCLTGWYSINDRNEERDVKIIADMINEKGGLTVKGQKYNIELVGEDGKSTMDAIAAGATRLAYDHKVKFVIGPGAFFSKASSPIFERNKILHVSAYMVHTPGEVDASTPYGFVTFSPLDQVLAAAEFMKKEFPNVKKVALITPEGGTTPYVIPRVQKVLELHKYTVVGETVEYPNEMIDTSPVAAKLNAIKDADLIFHLHGTVQSVGSIIKGLRELGNSKPYVVCINTIAEDLLKSTGNSAGTNILNIGLSNSAKTYPPIVQEIIKRSPPNVLHYIDIGNALWVLAHFIQAANSLEPAEVKAKWESTDKVDTVFGPGFVCGDESFGIKHHAVSRPMPYSMIMDGKVTFGGWQKQGSLIP